MPLIVSTSRIVSVSVSAPAQNSAEYQPRLLPATATTWQRSRSRRRNSAAVHAKISGETCWPALWAAVSRSEPSSADSVGSPAAARRVSVAARTAWNASRDAAGIARDRQPRSAAP